MGNAKMKAKSKRKMKLYTQRGAACYRGCSTQAVRSAIARGDLEATWAIGHGGVRSVMLISEDALRKWTPWLPGKRDHTAMERDR